MDYSSCVSYLNDYEKNLNEVASDISSTTEAMAREFFPLTADCTGFLGQKEVGDPHQETASAKPKWKSMVSVADAETLIDGKKAKYNRTHKKKKEASGCDTEEHTHNGVSTELALLFDPYKIKKKLTQSDVGHLSRLLIEWGCLSSHLLRWMTEETVRQVESRKGAGVIMRDVETRSDHRLVFVFWASSSSYVLKRGWIKEFTKRRGLAVGDEVGIYWDPWASKLHFNLLHKAN